jgi:hypothetical protein
MPSQRYSCCKTSRPEYPDRVHVRIGPARVHRGICDASAAVFIDATSTRFLVADDEDQQRTLLRLYESNQDGGPVAEYLLSNDALDPDRREPEIDLEGSAWLGERIFWIGSHSRNKDGEHCPSRHRLFATELERGVPAIKGHPYCTLLRDVRHTLRLDLDREVPPKDGGISIEGLSCTATPGELLIAFRSPLVNEKALLVPLRNADAIVDERAAAALGDPVLLDLGGLGVRSLEYWPERASYFLIAGPAGERNDDFRLMQWSGPGSTPAELELSFDDLGVDRGAPEGLLIDRQSETMYILFDEGNRIVDGVKCKKSRNRSFRSIALRLQ